MKIKLKEVIKDFIVPMRDKPKVFDGDIPWCRIEDIEGKYLFKSLSNQNVSKKTIDAMNLKVYPLNTLLFTCSASIGITAITKELVCTNQTFIGLVPSEKIDIEYLYYYLNKVGYGLKKSASITTIPYLPRRFFEELVIEIPDKIEKQGIISKILSDLDAKIELNNKINRELEAMAKTLYDYWFVQFDFPNAQGKPYKSSGGIMVYNTELKREIPEGWKVKKLSEIESNIITGKTPSTTVIDYFGGNIPFITIDDIRGQLFVLSTERTLSKSGADSQMTKYLKKGDICASCIGTIGVIGIASQISQTNQQINSVSIQKFYNRYFLLNALKDYFTFNVAAKKGAVLLNMNKAEFSNIPILDSELSVKDKFNSVVEPIYNIIEINLKENQQLSELRDWLLPMLMKGQVTIKEAEERLSMVAEPNVEYKKW